MPSHSIPCSFLALPLHLLQGMEQSEGSTPPPATLWLVQKWTYDLNPSNQCEPRDIYGDSAGRHSFGLECVAWTCGLSCCCNRFLPQGKLKRSQYKGGGQSQGTCSEMEPEPWHHKRSNEFHLLFNPLGFGFLLSLTKSILTYIIPVPPPPICWKDVHFSLPELDDSLLCVFFLTSSNPESRSSCILLTINAFLWIKQHVRGQPLLSTVQSFAYGSHGRFNSGTPPKVPFPAHDSQSK